MAGVHIAEAVGGGVILRVEERGVAVFGGGVVEHGVDPGDHAGDVVACAHGIGAQGSLQAGHGEGGGDAFAGDVAKSDAEFAVGEGEKIVVVAAHTESGAAAAEVIESGNFWEPLGEEALLY